MMRKIFYLVLIGWGLLVMAKIIAPLMAGAVMFGVYVFVWTLLRKKGREREGMIAGALILVYMIAALYFADWGIVKNLAQYHKNEDIFLALTILGEGKGLPGFLAIQIKYWPYILIEGFVLSLTVIPVVFGYYYWKNKRKRERLKERQNPTMSMDKKTEQNEPVLAGIRERF